MSVFLRGEARSCFVGMQTRSFCRNFYPTRDQDRRIKRVLEDILQKKVLQEPVVWKPVGLLGLEADLHNGIKAELLPGHEDNNTVIRVSDGIHSVYCEISAYWLSNWSVNVKDKI